MATVERYKSFEEMEMAEEADSNSTGKAIKKNKLTTIKEFASLLRKNVIAKSQPNIKKPQ